MQEAYNKETYNEEAYNKEIYNEEAYNKLLWHCCVSQRGRTSY